MKLNELTLSNIDLQIIGDYNKIHNGQFISIGYRTYDKRKKQGYDKETNTGGAYIERTHTNIQKGVNYSAFMKVQNHIEATGEALQPRPNVVEIEGIDGLEYNTNTKKVNIFAPGANIETKKESVTYHIPDGKGGYNHNATEAEYKAYLASFGLTTEKAHTESKRGIDVRLFTVANIITLNGIKYR